MGKKTISSFIAALRKANGLTQKQLADKLNMSGKAVSRWERDECAPDLSLIPVLAEIFSVTSDEILRYQRNNPDAAVGKIDTVKSEKQRKHLLDSTQCKFRYRSVVSAAIAFVGLIVAYICNFEFSKPNAGFMLGIVFYVIAIVCEITGVLSTFASIRDEDGADTSVVTCKTSMILWSEGIIVTAVIILFSATLRLADHHSMPVPFLTCLTDGIIYILIAVVVCFIVSLVLNMLLIRVKRYHIILNSILSMLLISLMVGHVFLNDYLINNRHVYAPCDKFVDLYKFRSYIEDPRDPEGNHCWIEKKVSNTIDDQSDNVFVFENDYNGQKYLYKELDTAFCMLYPIYSPS